MAGDRGTGRVVVVGAGVFGVASALALTSRDFDVTLVEMLDQVLPPVDPEHADVVETHLKRHGVHLALGDGVAAFKPASNGAGAIEVQTKSGNVYPADVVIRDASLSRQHACFEVEGGRVWVEDLGSTNGTWVAGQRVERFEVVPGAELALGAAMAASGAVALYHVNGATPEADRAKTSGLDAFKVDRKDLDAVFLKLNSGTDPDLLVFGCPHASLKQVSELAAKLAGKKLRKPLWVCTSRMVKTFAAEMGWARTIEQAGGRLVADTCMVVAPIEEMGFKTVAVDSGKAANYLPGFCGQKVVFGSMDALLEAAFK